MESSAENVPESKTMLWAGYLVSALHVLALTMSAMLKFIKPEGFSEGIEKLGWNVSQANGLGFLELACTILYVIPQTSVFGAILLTGYLGGATATHVRVGDPWFATVILGILIWLGLFLRDPRLRALLPLRS